MGEGQADIDIPKLIAILPEGPAVGWDAARGSETSFLSLTGEFLLRRGGIYTDSLKVDLGKSAIKGEGTIDIMSKALDMRLLMTQTLAKSDAKPKTSPDDQKPKSTAAGTIIINGPLSDPTFSLEPAKSSAQNTISSDPTQTALRGRY
jgi:hypothetical protein